MDELMSLFNQNPEAQIVELSTKLALEWADQHKPLDEKQLANVVSQLIGSFESGLEKHEDKAMQLALVKSSARLSHYWYQQNKAASLDELCDVIKVFLAI